MAAAATVLALAGTPALAADIPPPDTVVTSPNVTHVLNVPKPAPIAGTINTDIAFQGDYAYVGNYGGFSIYDIRDPRRARPVSSVVCPGAQMDVSVYGDLLFAAVDSSRNDDSCSSTGQSATVKESWEGVRIFDVSDKTNPKYIKSVETNCGSHTLTLVPGKGRDRDRNVYVYVSSYQPSDSFPDCLPPHDKISIIKVPLRDPAGAAVAATPVIFPDGGNETQPGLLLPTSGCHDITAYPEKDIAAGACMGDGVLFDISDRLNPKVTARTTDPNFAFWHSATFSNDARKVVFTDELGGGAATCNEATGPTRGADAIYEIVKGKFVFKSYFKIPRYQADSENCVAHNGSLIPVKGRDIMVQAWYMGGLSVWDFTDSANPREIGYFERGPRGAGGGGGIWSAYYYNGYIYGADFHEGLDVIKIDDPRTDSAKRVRTDRLNVQTQGSYHGRGHG
ncbi:LVIVD repeat-containing protein [Nonomuraea sp. NPDC004297]